MPGSTLPTTQACLLSPGNLGGVTLPTTQPSLILRPQICRGFRVTLVGYETGQERQTQTCSNHTTNLVPGAYFPRSPIFPVATGYMHTGMSDNVREKVTQTLREIGLEPKVRVRTYQKSYPEIFNIVPYPMGF
jgi:hypothetical protein